MFVVFVSLSHHRWLHAHAAPAAGDQIVLECRAQAGDDRLTWLRAGAGGQQETPARSGVSSSLALLLFPAP